MDALEALRTRRSVRAYRPDPIPRATLEAIVDAARLAASANNVQPVEMVVVTDAAMRRRLADTTDHGKFIAEAPACVVVLCRETKYWLEDGCAATQNLLVAARAYGLGSCWVAGEKKAYADTVRELVGAPAGTRLVALVPLGFPASVPQPSKRPLDEVLHWERF